MKKITKYGWIMGFVCLGLAGWHTRIYMDTGAGLNLIFAIATGVAGVFNLVTYWVCWRLKKKWEHNYLSRFN